MSGNLLAFHCSCRWSYWKVLKFNIQLLRQDKPWWINGSLNTAVIHKQARNTWVIHRETVLLTVYKRCHIILQETLHNPAIYFFSTEMEHHVMWWFDDTWEKQRKRWGTAVIFIYRLHSHRIIIEEHNYNTFKVHEILIIIIVIYWDSLRPIQLFKQMIVFKSNSLWLVLHHADEQF